MYYAHYCWATLTVPYAIISSSQSAFIPGRSIVDNTLMVQELLCGYRRRSLYPRCSLKIDLHKAFDSIDSNFILRILDALGMPLVMIGWNKECITTPRSSVSLNGGLQGSFKGVSSGGLEDILDSMGVKRGCLSVKYLGIPLVLNRLSIRDCTPLIDKITAKL
ncbi:uncharacterized protein LOC120141215 [Hibiscus syriacus]|uniref:uncharacterized protein LOC120141215 n=1 Tax=Hibiscus syriacus TaxID=106335 RepID=UPI0019249336|nr:uncharacterized protein LOC120141215 [Hibiscus syriacus]